MPEGPVVQRHRSSSYEPNVRKSPAEDLPAGKAEKGVQNRRFWCVFGYFLHKQKVPEGSGGEKSPGYRIESASPAPAGRKKGT